MSYKRFYEKTGRKILITGHYGSGKTEFAVSLAMLMAAENIRNLAIVDLDIVNPYFRSRERRDILENMGVSVYGSIYSHEVTAEMPALGATIRTPLEDTNCRVIVDAGGNDSGALILNQFTKYFTDGDTTVLAVVNANRPETSSLEGSLGHIKAIEAATNLTLAGIVNNSHLLRETTSETVKKGHNLCKAISESTGKPIYCNCYPESIVDPQTLATLPEPLIPLALHMRPTWLDK